jgi:predicted acyltransferase
LTSQEESITNKPRRFLSIDILKGVTVLLMIFVNSIQIYDDIPAWTKHAGDYGLTYVDLVAPFFIFMLALNLNISYNHRVEEFGRKKVLLRYLRRYLTFVGIGLVLTIYIDVNVFSLRWGTLQVLGASGLMLLPFLNLKPYVKLVVAVLFMGLHQYLLFTPISIVIYDSIEGGIFGIFSWGSMMILSSFLAEGLEKGKKYVTRYFFFGGLICVLTGIGFAYFFGISRAFISIPYILISVGLASILYCFLYYMYEVWGKNYSFVKKERIFSAVGRNAFIFFLIHILIAYSIYTIFPNNTSSIIIFSLAIGHAAFIWLLAYFLNKYEIYIII